MTTVTMRHMREVRYCAKGVRKFFSDRGLDFRVFLRDGIPAEQLEATGDSMAQKVVDHARQEALSNGRQ